jgi:hypothetical protein
MTFVTISMEKYGAQFLFALIILLGMALILPMSRYATRVGEKPSFWLSPLVLSWGFLWVLLSRVNWTWFTDGYTFWWKWGAFALISICIYVFFWWRIIKKGKENISKKIEEIGKESSKESS